MNDTTQATDAAHAHSTHQHSMQALAIAAIGVVFGDIGTSPLYSLKEAFSPAHGIPLTESSILGVISLLFWAIVLVVGIKYLLFVMRADNNGEGGVLALMALSLRPLDSKTRVAAATAPSAR
ncbi:MAG: KUP/HAK/KT family potassium transporter, partial [Burkholderia vietnamiensis]|nr:KUP/HAK/KT family potassium transporter [Burkholderia vietnamiensis]